MLDKEIKETFSMERFRRDKWQVFGYEPTFTDAVETIAIMQKTAEEGHGYACDWRVCKVVREVVYMSAAKAVEEDR